jgi:cytochrome P450
MERLPPGPKRLGPIECFQGGAIPSFARIEQLGEIYGDTFRLPYRSGAITLTGNPEAIRSLYTADPDGFEVWGGNATEPVFGTGSLVVASGPRHRADRRLLSPHFSASWVENYSETIAAIARSAAARWVAGRRFSMLRAAQEITLEVIMRLIFGVQGEERVRRTRAAVLELIESTSPLLVALPMLRRNFGGIGPWARSRRAVCALNALLSEQIRERTGPPEERQDILSRLLSARYDDGSAMEQSVILDQLRGLLFAGHDTTAMTLTWALVRLHREPRALAELLAELDRLGPAPAAQTFTTLPFLDAVCCEVLRLHPPVVDVARIVRRPFRLLDFVIPAGEAIRATLPLLHMREDLYPGPARFRPERFLERKFSPFEFIPFGGGPRRCLGAAFAMHEMKIVLGTILQRYVLRLAGRTPATSVRRGLTMGPGDDVPMVVCGMRTAGPVATGEVGR